MSLESLPCPKCGAMLVAAAGVVTKAERFEDCLRRCEPCGVAWSNGASEPRAIWRDPLDNVPEAVRSGLDDAIAKALNVRNREMKRVKLASERSEDAITWTVMQYLVGYAEGDAHWRLLLGRHVPATPIPSPTTLIWGVPASGTEANELRTAIEAVLDRLGEALASRTEPDVVLDFGALGIVLIEVKYRSGNDRQDDKPWSKYVDDPSAFLDPAAARESGRYELVRNWRLGCDLARGRPLTLVNLVVQRETGAERARTELLERSLRLDGNRRFLRLTFGELLADVPAPWPAWFATYVASRGLVAGQSDGE